MIKKLKPWGYYVMAARQSAYPVPVVNSIVLAVD
jgi:hypothetical protein